MDGSVQKFHPSLSSHLNTKDLNLGYLFLGHQCRYLKMYSVYYLKKEWF